VFCEGTTKETAFAFGFGLNDLTEAGKLFIGRP